MLVVDPNGEIFGVFQKDVRGRYYEMREVQEMSFLAGALSPTMKPDEKVSVGVTPLTFEIGTLEFREEVSEFETDDTKVGQRVNPMVEKLMSSPTFRVDSYQDLERWTFIRAYSAKCIKPNADQLEEIFDDPEFQPL